MHKIYISEAQCQPWLHGARRAMSFANISSVLKKTKNFLVFFMLMPAEATPREAQCQSRQPTFGYFAQISEVLDIIKFNPKKF